jgi:hypothetical protein
VNKSNLLHEVTQETAVWTFLEPKQFAWQSLNQLHKSNPGCDGVKVKQNVDSSWYQY